MAGTGRASFGRVLSIAVVLLVMPAARESRGDPASVTVQTNVLTIRDDAVAPVKRKFSWAVRSGLDDPAHQTVTPVLGSASDPTPAGATGGGAVLIVYNSAGSGESFTEALPADHWRLQGNPTNGSRYIYANDPATRGVWKVWLKGPKLTVRGGRQHWGYLLADPSQGSVAIRLTLGTGVTYCADVPARTAGSPPSSVPFDHPGKFQGQPKTPHPVDCPPTP